MGKEHSILQLRLRSPAILREQTDCVIYRHSYQEVLDETGDNSLGCEGFHQGRFLYPPMRRSFGDKIEIDIADTGAA